MSAPKKDAGVIVYDTKRREILLVKYNKKDHFRDIWKQGDDPVKTAAIALHVGSMGVFDKNMDAEIRSSKSVNVDDHTVFILKLKNTKGTIKKFENAKKAKRKAKQSSHAAVEMQWFPIKQFEDSGFTPLPRAKTTKNAIGFVDLEDYLSKGISQAVQAGYFGNDTDTDTDSDLNDGDDKQRNDSQFGSLKQMRNKLKILRLITKYSHIFEHDSQQNTASGSSKTTVLMDVINNWMAQQQQQNQKPTDGACLTLLSLTTVSDILKALSDPGVRRAAINEAPKLANSLKSIDVTPYNVIATFYSDIDASSEQVERLKALLTKDTEPGEPTVVELDRAFIALAARLIIQHRLAMIYVVAQQMESNRDIREIQEIMHEMARAHEEQVLQLVHAMQQ